MAVRPGIYDVGTICNPLTEAICPSSPLEVPIVDFLSFPNRCILENLVLITVIPMKLGFTLQQFLKFLMGLGVNHGFETP